ncbi:protein farnesyltransferase subunit beta [Rutidosis leptorrhynchoides]|uniref:protein farnesyltransferase subunit beta n=1 Tax=Rutidosis leptorrhynchoides TaxID=125765 RepID=UPI003A9A469D
MESSSSSEWKPTVSQEEQWALSSQVHSIYQNFYNIPPKSQSVMLELLRSNHIEYLINGLRRLPSSFSVLDANRPWLCYWILHSIALLGDSVDVALERSAIDFLSRCQDQDGGYGGGPGQMPHLATTYAAVNSLITLGGCRSLASINRGKIHSFLRRMKHNSGGFSMHDGGEVDVRACYTAISVASVLNILDEELVEGVGDYILSCQTYEGGIAGEPGSEAHGGYTFCGLATMILIDEVNRLDLAILTDWLLFRQGWEGGFQGRTNKLVDGCYSLWQGGAAVLIQRLHAATSEGHDECSTSSELSNSDDDDDDDDDEGQNSDDDQVNSSSIPFDHIQRHTEVEPFFNSRSLQQYILLCSQMEGGFRDKPGKSKDYYHTCYCLSGLAAAQYGWSKDDDSPPLPHSVVGPYDNLLQPINPLFNIVVERYNEAHKFFTDASA